ncbi:hypothetical protein PspLS_08466, partial [Pyricularia sp. CBS 133598]
TKSIPRFIFTSQSSRLGYKKQRREDFIANRWAALKVVAARDSPEYESRSVIANDPNVAGSRPFSIVERKFWLDGPNGRRLCFVSQVLGPTLSRLSKPIFSRMNPEFSRLASLQATRAFAHLHSKGLCHGDFTASNMTLRLAAGFDMHRPHGSDYIFAPLDFCTSNTSVLSTEVCIINFDQSFKATDPPARQPGIPSKYMAPKVAVGKPCSRASDVWALGCAIFRIRTGDDLFYSFTDCPANAFSQIVRALRDLPEQWRDVRFDEDGLVVKDAGREGQEDRGEPLAPGDNRRPLEDHVHETVEEPPALFLDESGNPTSPDGKPVEPASWHEAQHKAREPYSSAFRSMLWKPSAVCINCGQFTGYSDETDEMLKAFPKIAEPEASFFIDLLSKDLYT